LTHRRNIEDGQCVFGVHLIKTTNENGSICINVRVLTMLGASIDGLLLF